MYGHAYEVSTFRKDNAYFDGRHPSSVVFCGPEQDALRRDFTINGLFYDPIADRLIDYVHGKIDIQRRLIRTIGNPFDRFSEDKLRMLRAIRLSCSLGFKVVSETWNAIQKLAPGIEQVSAERIREELIKLLTGSAPDAGLNLLHDSGLLVRVLPEIAETRGIPQFPSSAADLDVFTHTAMALAMLRSPSPVLAFGALLHDVGKPSSYAANERKSYDGHAQVGGKISEEICRRLRMSNDEVEQVADLVRTHMDFMIPTDIPQSTLIRLLRKPNISDHLELYRVNCLSGGKSLANYYNYLEKLDEFRRQPTSPPLIKGDDLIELGYTPGPIFSQILRAVEDLQLNGVLRTRDEAIQHIQSAFPIPWKTGA
jgi:tRNA nucleotidyltransferase/poly(A) polymerase